VNTVPEVLNTSLDEARVNAELVFVEVARSNPVRSDRNTSTECHLADSRPGVATGHNTVNSVTDKGTGKDTSTSRQTLGELIHHSLSINHAESP
jgi:hypothetical protein